MQHTIKGHKHTNAQMIGTHGIPSPPKEKMELNVFEPPSVVASVSFVPVSLVSLVSLVLLSNVVLLLSGEPSARASLIFLKMPPLAFPVISCAWTNISGVSFSNLHLLAISGRSGISVRSMLTRSDSAVSSLQSKSLRSSSSGGLNCANSCLVTTFRLEKITRTFSSSINRPVLESMPWKVGAPSAMGRNSSIASRTSLSACVNWPRSSRRSPLKSPECEDDTCCASKLVGATGPRLTRARDA
mmetsp:Transcript_27480/g.72374  ORF Transcript_27480/g.72374 Transcript_27480/m.72374 type:complete len:243 (+) Transcript_27480:72-800(+)